MTNLQEIYEKYVIEPYLVRFKVSWKLFETRDRNAGSAWAANQQLRKKKSVVCNYFVAEKTTLTKNLVLCRECLAIVATTKGNTTNSLSHLICCNKALYKCANPNL